MSKNALRINVFQYGVKRRKSLLNIGICYSCKQFSLVYLRRKGAEKPDKPCAAAGSIEKDDLSVKTDLVIQLGKIAVTL